MFDKIEPVIIYSIISKEATMQLNQLASEALALHPKDRAILAMSIWESLEDPYILRQDISDAQAVEFEMKRLKVAR
jgi:hypothetical protein